MSHSRRPVSALAVARWCSPGDEHLEHGQIRRISRTIWRFLPRRWPSQYVTTTTATATPTAIAAAGTLAASVRLSTSPRSSRSFDSMSSRVIFVSGWLVRRGGGPGSCRRSSWLCSARSRRTTPRARAGAGDNDQVRHPRPVAGEVRDTSRPAVRGASRSRGTRRPNAHEERAAERRTRHTGRALDAARSSPVSRRRRRARAARGSSAWDCRPHPPFPEWPKESRRRVYPDARWATPLGRFRERGRDRPGPARPDIRRSHARRRRRCCARSWNRRGRWRAPRTTAPRPGRRVPRGRRRRRACRSWRGPVR